MIMRTLFLALFLLGTSAHAQQRRAPQCGPDRDESRAVRQVFSVLTDDYWATERAKAQMTLTTASAPRGVLNDNDTCVHLRKALEQVVGKGSDELGDRHELGFYFVGDYYAVFSRVKPDPTSELQVNQHLPMRIFTREKKPRLVMTVYM